MGAAESKPEDTTAQEVEGTSEEASSSVPTSEVKGDQNAETSEKRASPSGDQGGEGSGAEGDEEYECPLCTFMKGGACKDEFLKWEECVDRVRDEGGNMAEECGQLFLDMNTCMLSNKDYYAPILALNEEALEEAEKEEKEGASGGEKEAAKEGA